MYFKKLNLRRHLKVAAFFLNLFVNKSTWRVQSFANADPVRIRICGLLIWSPDPGDLENLMLTSLSEDTPLVIFCEYPVSFFRPWIGIQMWMNSKTYTFLPLSETRLRQNFHKDSLGSLYVKLLTDIQTVKCWVKDNLLGGGN